MSFGDAVLRSALPASSSTVSTASAPCGIVHSRGSLFVANGSVFGEPLEKAARSSRRRRLTPASASASALAFSTRFAAARIR